MPAPTSLTVPRIHQFAIGEQVASTDTLIGVLERLNAPLQDVILGLAINEGLSAYTLALNTGIGSTGLLSLTAQPADGNTIVIDDGPGVAITFEFDSNASVTESATLRQVVIGATVMQTLGNLYAALRGSALNITPAIPTLAPGSSVAGSIALKNNIAGTATNVTITKTGANITVAGMAGGTGAAKNIRVNAASVASVSVVPQARVPFLIEIGSSDVQDFLNFTATPATGSKAFGSLTLMLINGDFTHRNSYA